MLDAGGMRIWRVGGLVRPNARTGGMREWVFLCPNSSLLSGLGRVIDNAYNYLLCEGGSSRVRQEKSSLGTTPLVSIWHPRRGAIIRINTFISV